MSRSARILVATVLMVTFALGTAAYMHSGGREARAAEPSKLCVVWTSGDRDVALSMVFMYVYNAKKHDWWDEVTLVVWGPSSRLLAGDRELQEYLERMKDEGVRLQACVACARMYGVEDELTDLGIEVKGMGVPLTEMARNGWKTMTF